MHVAIWDFPFCLDEQFDCFTWNLKLAEDQLLVTSMLIALLQLEVEHDFLELLSCCELWVLLNVADFVILVDLLKLNQWHSLFCVNIDKEDLIFQNISCNCEREVGQVKAVR